MFHLALYSAAVAVSATLTQVAAVADPVIAPSASGFLVNAQAPFVMRVAGVGNILQRGQLTSASIRKYVPFDFSPVSVGTKIGTPAPFVDWSVQPFQLAVNEELDAFASNSAASSTQTTIAVWFCDGPPRPVSGQIFSVHWTASTTLVANAWTNTALTLDNGLPSGTFAIVGSRMKSAGALFHRFVPRGGQSSLRPGSFSVQANSDLAESTDRYGYLGQWMQFTNTTPPSMDIFSGTADTSEEGYLDLIKVG